MRRNYSISSDFILECVLFKFLNNNNNNKKSKDISNNSHIHGLIGMKKVLNTKGRLPTVLKVVKKRELVYVGHVMRNSTYNRLAPIMQEK